MARITIAGDAIVITSALKLEDIRMLEKHDPNYRVLKGGENGKDPIYMISTGKGCGSLSEYGAVFASETHDENGFATITICAKDELGGAADYKEAIVERFGSSIMHLNELEAQLPAVIADVAGKKELVRQQITVMQ